MIETSEPAPELRLFTVELAYTVLSCATVKVEAVSFEDACAKALADPPHDDFEDNNEATGETFVLQLAQGDVELCSTPGALANVPIAYADEADQLRWERDRFLTIVEGAAMLPDVAVALARAGFDVHAALREFHGASDA